MSYAGRIGLPRTRSLQRLRKRQGWWIAVGIALGANGIIVVALGQVSCLGHPPVQAPLAVHRLNRVEPDPPPPAAEPPSEALPDEAVAAPVPLALPMLDLPAASTSDLSVPNLGSVEVLTDLPVAVPAFAPFGPADTPAMGAVLAVPGAYVDSSAQREGSFDLDRHYPRAAKARRVTGNSRIRSWIDASGRVTAVEVLDSQPPGVFEQAAERVGRAQRYVPARRGGTAVPTVQDTNIEWKLQ